MPSLISQMSWADQAGVSIGTDAEVVGLGVRSLLTTTIADVWRTPGVVQAGGSRAVALDLDLGAARAVRVLALSAPPDGMLPAAGSLIRVTAGTVAGGSDLLDTSMQALAMPRGTWAWIGAAVVTARYWRIQMSWPGSQPYLQFGRLWLGDALVQASGPSADSYEPSASDDVATVPVRRESWQILRLSETEADEVERIGLAVGTQVQVLAIPRTERAAYTAVIGKFATIPRTVPRQAWASGQVTRLYSTTLTVQGDR